MPADRSIPTYQCSYPDCNYTGSKLGAIIGHVNNLHKNGLRPFKCPVPGCTETFGSGSTLGSHKRECLRLYCARDGLDPNAMNALLPSGTVMVEDYLNPMEQDRDTTYGRSFDQEGSRGHLDEKMDEQDEVDGLLACMSVPEPAAIRAGPLVPSLTSSVSSLESSFVELEIKREIKIEEEEIQLWPELPKIINHAVSAAPPLIHSPMPLPVAPRMRFAPPGILPAVGALGHLSGQPMVQCVPQMPLYGPRPMPAPIACPYPYPYIGHYGYHLAFQPPVFAQPPNPYAMAISPSMNFPSFVASQAPGSLFNRPVPMPVRSSEVQRAISPAPVPNLTLTT